MENRVITVSSTDGFSPNPAFVKSGDTVTFKKKAGDPRPPCLVTITSDSESEVGPETLFGATCHVNGADDISYSVLRNASGTYHARFSIESGGAGIEVSGSIIVT